MGRALTKEDVKLRLSPRGIQLVGKWHGTAHKSRFKCSKGHIWKAQGSSVLHGNGCAKCSATSLSAAKKVTKATINERLKPRGIQVVGKWQGASQKNRFACSFGHKWTATASGVLYLNSGCPHCADLKHRLGRDEVQARLAMRGIRLEGEWQGLLAQNRYSCDACGHRWRASGRGPVGLGTGCPSCNKFPGKLTEARVNLRLAPYGLSLVGTWNGKASSNRFKCSLGHEWETKGLAPLEGVTGCPECSRLRRKNRLAFA